MERQTENTDLVTKSTMQTTSDPIFAETGEPGAKNNTPTSQNNNRRFYLFEFALLLAAVALGFVGDNLREKYSEKQQAAGYLRSFYEDLRTDTARIGVIIQHEEQKIQILESTVACYKSVTTTPSNMGCLATIVRNSFVSTPFVMTDRTLQQLQNGGFRLLETKDTDKILKYVAGNENLQDFQTTIYQESQLEVRRSQAELINFEAFADIVTMNVVNNDPGYQLPPGVVLLHDANSRSLNRFFNELLKHKSIAMSHVFQMRLMRKNQEELMRYFQEQHGFE